MKKSCLLAVLCLVLSAWPVMAAETEKESSLIQEAQDPSSLLDSSEFFKEILEADDYYVQQGQYRELDTVKLASEGKLLSCFGNNAGSAYIVFNLPAAPEQDTSIE